MKDIKFIGTTTIGPKGQIVIPAKLRQSLKIKNQDQFLVLHNENMDGIILMKTKDMTKMLQKFTKQVNTIAKKINSKDNK